MMGLGFVFNITCSEYYVYNGIFQKFYYLNLCMGIQEYEYTVLHCSMKGGICSEVVGRLFTYNLPVNKRHKTFWQIHQVPKQNILLEQTSQNLPSTEQWRAAYLCCNTQHNYDIELQSNNIQDQGDQMSHFWGNCPNKDKTGCQIVPFFNSAVSFIIDTDFGA